MSEWRVAREFFIFYFLNLLILSFKEPTKFLKAIPPITGARMIVLKKKSILISKRSISIPKKIRKKRNSGSEEKKKTRKKKCIPLQFLRIAGNAQEARTKCARTDSLFSQKKKSLPSTFFQPPHRKKYNSISRLSSTETLI